MPAKKPTAKPSGPHTPGTSRSREAAAAPCIKKTEPKPPSDGTGEATAPVNADGRDAVSGHKPLAATPVECRYSAPEGDELRDIGEASFGPPSPRAETVHGVDDRARITNTAAYPWRVHASLSITAADGSMWIGTG